MRSSLLRLWLLRRILSFPSALIRFFAGGGVVYHGGQTLDPQIQFLWRTWFAPAESSGRMPLTMSDKSLDRAREEWHDIAGFLGAPGPARVRIETLGDPAMPAGTIPNGLLIKPLDIAPDAPVLVFFPQGGGVLGGAELSRTFCTLLAIEARCPVFIPTLRMAPEARFPAALDDARHALDWSLGNASRLGSRSGDVAIGGVLTGAALAMRLCLDLHRDVKPMPVAQLLVTPLVDLSDTGITSSPYGQLWPLSAADIGLIIAYYAGAGVDLADPRPSPALAVDLAGQPRTFLVSAGLDPLAPQAEILARRLIDARTSTVYRRYDTLPLGFDLFAGTVDVARAATADIARTWVELLRRDRAPDDADMREVA
jgi:acetyl esterase